jgi:fructose-bisphosphate aldolase class II
MKFTLQSLAALLVFQNCAAFAPAFKARSETSLGSASTSAKKEGGISEELGTPCEDDCAITSYANLPKSVHPGVLSGRAQMDLLKHAKENGE